MAVVVLGSVLAGCSHHRSAAPRRESVAEAYVDAVHRDLFGRSATARERVDGARQLASGHLSRSSYTRLLAARAEWSDLVVDDLYERLLGRAPDAITEAHWSTLLGSGARAADLVADVTTRPGFGGAEARTGQGWIHLVTARLLGPGAVARRMAAVFGAGSAGVGRAALAVRMYDAAPVAAARVARLYTTLLGRPPTAAEQARWTPRLEVADDQVLAAALTASDEYYRSAPTRVRALFLDVRLLPVGTAGTPYRAALVAAGGAGSDRWTAAGLPPGLALEGHRIAGTPQAPGTATVTVELHDRTGRTRRRTFGLTVEPAEPARRPVDDGRRAWNAAVHVLTPDGHDRYDLATRAGTLTVTAHRGNRGRNLRELVLAGGSPSLASAETCASWTAESDPHVQQGAALAVRVGPGGRVRALTVTKDVLYQDYAEFNVHTWDTARAGRPFQEIGHVTLSDELLDADLIAPLPWNVCARTHRGTVQFELWTGGEPQPAWGDPIHGGSVPIPPGWDEPGAAGWFVGHVPPGGSATFTGLRTWALADR